MALLLLHTKGLMAAMVQVVPLQTMVLAVGVVLEELVLLEAELQVEMVV